MKKILVAVAVLVVVGAFGSFIPVGGEVIEEPGSTAPGPAMDLSQYSEDPPGTPLRLLFIHHSVGGTLFATPGADGTGAHAPQCIWEEHPNGGGARQLLAEAGYEVHEAAYGSRMGEDTDIFHWLPKFGEHMDDVLRVDMQDETLDGELRNQIVLFKSCFPNSNFVGEGEAPGNPEGPELTVWNARASLTALLEHFAGHPEVLFVYVTAPPLAPPGPQPAWKWLAKKILGRSVGGEEQARAAALARQFNNWVRSPDGWLRGYEQDNVVVFDYFDVLTDHGQTNFLRYPTGGGTDSHPSTEGNRLAATELVPLINRAVRRAGLGDSSADDTSQSADAGVADGGARGDGAPAVGDGAPIVE